MILQSRVPILGPFTPFWYLEGNEVANAVNGELLIRKSQVQELINDLFEEEALPEAGVLLHSYSGGVELARFYLRKGCCFSFAGPVTWAEARKPLEALKSIPGEWLLAETDAPDQAPTPYRGQRSEPGYLPRVLEGMARVRGEPLDELSERTSANARRLFRM